MPAPNLGTRQSQTSRALPREAYNNPGGYFTAPQPVDTRGTFTSSPSAQPNLGQGVVRDRVTGLPVDPDNVFYGTGGTALVRSNSPEAFAPAPTPAYGKKISVQPGTAARRGTLRNIRAEALLGSADDLFQGEGQGLDTLLSQQLLDLITGQQSDLTRTQLADQNARFGNTLNLARQQLGAQAAAAGLGRSASPILTEAALISRVSADQERARQNLLAQRRQEAAGLLNAILQQRAQRAQILTQMRDGFVEDGGNNFLSSALPAAASIALAPTTGGGSLIGLGAEALFG